MKSEDLSKFDELVVLRLKELLLSRHGLRAGDGKDDVLEAASRFDAADLNELVFALRRIEKGIYGQCVICRHDIPVNVLKSNLTARLCPSCETVMHEKTDPSR
jgi:RNA polymerase-binding transcription factor DksA